ncbi:CoA transferase [Arthrobacter sp. NPDC080031]|uniref:CaiB/BaiF CoA transferase family protein n=1 Tax=Arthrobacter sp. NPDC080031 TaxID=3155918 RepID=UPI003450B761
MNDATTSSPGPLNGLTVVDMTTSYAGPSASMYLADLGATVVKVERPGFGDDARSWGPPFVQGASAWFASANRNKKSVVVNVRHPEGIRVLHDLIGKADVFMQNLNPGKLAKLGVDHQTLTAKYPRLIYCALSGFGLDGPDHQLPGYDLVAQARSGIMSVTGAKGGAPQRVSTALSDVVTGMCAALAISAAAVRQARTNQGEVIDVSLLDTDLAIMAPRIAAHLAGEPEPAPSGGTDSVLAVYQSFPTADREIVVAIGNDAMWHRFCAIAGLEDLSAEPSLADNAGRQAKRTDITARVAERLQERPAADWLAVFGEHGVPASLIQGLSEVVSDQQVLARESLMPVPGVDGLHSVHSPFRLASQPIPRNERFPELGADTEEILESLGYDLETIQQLTKDGAVETYATSAEVLA